MIPKFRVWDKKEKQLLNIGLIDLEDKIVYVARNKYFNKSYSDRNMQKRRPEWGLFEDLIFMQSTGLKDKYGVEIFEGDIVEVEKDFFNIIDYRVNDGCWRLKPLDSQYAPSYFSNYYEKEEWEIIGNIYENPELLEVE